MTPDRWERMQSLFFAVCDLDPAARAVRLADACQDDPLMKSEVEELVRAESHSGTAWDASISKAIAAAVREVRCPPRGESTQ
jgi:hypothetical protein